MAEIVNLSFEEAKTKIQNYEYALIYGMSEIVFDEVSRLSEIAWEEMLEARFFSDKGELHFFEDEENMRAVEVTDEAENSDENEYVCDVKKYKLGGKHREVASGLQVKEYLDYDEDGQIFVKLTRLCGVVK